MSLWSSTITGGCSYCEFTLSLQLAQFEAFYCYIHGDYWCVDHKEPRVGQASSLRALFTQASCPSESLLVEEKFSGRMEDLLPFPLPFERLQASLSPDGMAESDSLPLPLPFERLQASSSPDGMAESDLLPFFYLSNDSKLHLRMAWQSLTGWQGLTRFCRPLNGKTWQKADLQDLCCRLNGKNFCERQCW